MSDAQKIQLLTPGLPIPADWLAADTAEYVLYWERQLRHFLQETLNRRLAQSSLPF